VNADVIVVGLGAMGSAAAQQLAERGARVLGLDRFTPPHTLGSSHGLSRMYRQAYWEDPRYVPLLLRAFEQWHKLSERVGEKLFHVTGGLAVGARGGELVTRTLESAEQFGLPHALLSADELRRRFPVFAESDAVAVLEQNAGYVVPERAIYHQLALAEAAGARLCFDETVVSWSAGKDGVAVETTKGTYRADQLVLTAGPWASEVWRELRMPLRVTRQVLYWLAPEGDAEHFAEGRLPVFLFEAPPGVPMVYGFPSVNPAAHGVKVALHGSDEVTTPEQVRREVTAEDEAAMRERLRTTLPALAEGRLLEATTCLYTMTPDEHFVLDHHPEHANVTLAAGFSGHGFKFATVMGEILADLALTGATRWDIGLFSLARLGASFAPAGRHEGRL
jgi:sarcosine oxidase